MSISIHSWHLLFDHFQFAMIDGPNIPGSYTVLLFIASDFTSITSHVHNWVLFLLWLCLFILLELFLHSLPVAYWAPTDLGSFSFSILSFCLFILFMGFSRQEYWFAILFSSGPHSSDLSTMTRPSWVAPHGMAWFHWVKQGCGLCDQIG